MLETPRPVAGLPELVLTDGELVLRPWTLDDATVRVRAGADPAIRQWTTVPRDADLAAAEAWVVWADRARRDGDALYLALTEHGRCVGSVGLIHFVPEHGRAEVGYWLLPEGRGRNLSGRALALLVRWSFANLTVNRLDLFTNTDNLASMAVAEKAGFRREALLRSWQVTPWGEREDLVLFGMLREEAP